LPADAHTSDARSLIDHEKLRAWRGDVTREVVCAAVGLSANYLQRMESGERNPTLVVLTRLARYYGHEPGELLRAGTVIEA
jgi:transcriptional regulator with XRE-family HTH domain